MRTENASPPRTIKLIENTVGPDNLRWVVAGRYVERQLLNERLTRYLAKHHDEILNEFRKIVAHLGQLSAHPKAVATAESGTSHGGTHGEDWGPGPAKGGDRRNHRTVARIKCGGVEAGGWPTASF